MTNELDFTEEEEVELTKCCKQINHWYENDPIGFYKDRLLRRRERLQFFLRTNPIESLIENEKKLVQLAEKNLREAEEKRGENESTG